MLKVKQKFHFPIWQNAYLPLQRKGIVIVKHLFLKLKPKKSFGIFPILFPQISYHKIFQTASVYPHSRQFTVKRRRPPRFLKPWRSDMCRSSWLAMVGTFGARPPMASHELRIQIVMEKCGISCNSLMLFVKIFGRELLDHPTRVVFKRQADRH